MEKKKKKKKVVSTTKVKAANDSSNKYNTSTGKLNPNYKAPKSSGDGDSVINIDSNPGQALAPGQKYTYKGVTYTQPGGSSSSGGGGSDTLFTSTTLNTGSKGDEVKALQTYLKGMGYNIASDGIYGPKTKAAVMDLQAKNGLVVDGIVGNKTKEAITKAQTTDTPLVTQQNAKPVGIPDAEWNAMTAQEQTLARARVDAFEKLAAENGYKINPKLTIDENTEAMIYEQEKKYVEPILREQIDDVYRQAKRDIAQQQAEQVKNAADNAQTFARTMKNTQEAFAESGATFSGERALTEADLNAADQRTRDYNDLIYRNTLADIGARTGRQIGSANMKGLNIPSNYGQYNYGSLIEDSNKTAKQNAYNRMELLNQKLGTQNYYSSLFN